MSFSAIFELSSLDGTNGFQINGRAANDRTGGDVSSAGDINGDGYDDIIVGARGADTNGADAGASYVIFGGPGGFSASLNLSALNGTNGFRMTGAATLDYSGVSVAAAGDINGDGYDDLIVGAEGADPNGARSGSSYIVFGKATSFGASFSLSTLNGTTGFAINGEAAQDRSGYAVSAAGDVNGDGYADVIIGAWSADPNGTSSGASYVVFGKASGFAPSLNLSTLDGTNGFQINGEAAYDQSGLAVATAGDVNNDGFDDLVIGAPGADPGGSLSGASYVVFGKASGFAATLELSALDGTDGFQISGQAASDINGVSVHAAGDVNADGFGDIIVGASRASPNAFWSGASYVVFGKASGFGADLDLSTLDGTNGFKISGQSANDGAGNSVAAAGDVNGDGFDDLIVGAMLADTNGANAGASYVVFGKSGAFSANLNLSTLDGTNGFKINGEFAQDSSGRSVASAGDFNGDGLADILIGAYLADPGNNEAGGVYIIFGQAAPSGFTATAGDDTFAGTPGVDTLNGLGGKDVLNGAGSDDIIDGGDGNDMLYGDAGDDTVAGGSGNDVLDGGDGNDVLTDSGGSNKFYGGAGDDIIIAGLGADRLNGESDDDTLNGGAGNDYLDGGSGVNTLTGGTGNDVYIVRSTDDTVVENPGEGTDTVRATISYTLGANVEILELLTGTDIDGTGNALDNVLRGNGGANVLSGLGGNDKLDGGGGADTLIGGTGRDQLTGGTGSDTFRVLEESIGLSPLEIDTVTDYELGTDRLDVSLIDADGDGTNGDTAFSVSLSGLTKVAGQLYAFYTASVATTTVRLDVDGDGKADYQMALKGGDFTADATGWLL